MNPPSPSGAVSKDFVVETTSQEFRIYKKNGFLSMTLQPKDLFYNPVVRSYSNPRILYDPNKKHFIICMLGYDVYGSSTVFIAVSRTDDPTFAWYVYTFSGADSQIGFLQSPQLGFNSNWVVITAQNILGNGYLTNYIYALNASGLYNGTVGVINFFSDRQSTMVTPAITYDASQTTEYLVTDPYQTSAGINYVNLYALTPATSTPGYGLVAALSTRNQSWNYGPNVAPQWSTSTPSVQSGYPSIAGCVYRNGALWFTHTVYLPASYPTHSGVDWWQVNPAALTVNQFGRLEDTTGHIFYYYPSLDVNPNGDMMLGFTYSSNSQPISNGYAIRLASDPPGTLAQLRGFQQGSGPYTRSSGAGQIWGNYSGTAFDPADNSFWTFQEYPNSANTWATAIAHVPDSETIKACGIPASLVSGNAANTSIRLSWVGGNYAQTTIVRYRPRGTSTWTIANCGSCSHSPGYLAVTGLTPGTYYEWQVQSVCSSATSSAFSPSAFFNTTGSCLTPINFNAHSTFDTSTVSWTPVSGAVSYHVRYWIPTISRWATLTIQTNSYAWSGLPPQTKYYFQVQAICSSNTDTSAYSPLDSFTTPVYCASHAGNSSNEYIRTVAMKAVSHTTANDGGYGKYTSPYFTAGATDTIYLTPGFAGAAHTEYWSVYIDYNHDGIFEPSTELVASGSGSGTLPLIFNIPAATTKRGYTGMRIQMHSGSPVTDPCATLDFGDVHDYLVFSTVGKPIGTGMAETEITATAASITSETPAPPLSEQALELKVIPNPLPATVAPTVVYTLARKGNVSLKIVDLNGRVIQRADLGNLEAGRHSYLLSIAGNRVTAGYYILVLEQDKGIIARTRFIVQ